MFTEQQLIKYYESVASALKEHGFTVQTTYQVFNILDKNGTKVGTCYTIDGLSSWLNAYTYLSKES